MKPPITVESIVQEFEKRWNWASFTWNGDNKTGEDFARKTREEVRKYLRTSLKALLQSKASEMEKLKVLTPSAFDDADIQMNRAIDTCIKIITNE